jgi:uncharacterized cupin superfamily protein
VASGKSSPKTPPHFHKVEREFFLILHGRLDVMTDGAWKTVGAGSFVELLPGTVHTFVNKTDQDTVWLTGWRPKGFQKFLRNSEFLPDGRALASCPSRTS